MHQFASMNSLGAIYIVIMVVLFYSDRVCHSHLKDAPGNNGLRWKNLDEKGIFKNL